MSEKAHVCGWVPEPAQACESAHKCAQALDRLFKLHYGHESLPFGLLRFLSFCYLFLCWSPAINSICSWLCLNTACTNPWLVFGFCLSACSFCSFAYLPAVPNSGLTADFSFVCCTYLICSLVADPDCTRASWSVPVSFSGLPASTASSLSSCCFSMHSALFSIHKWKTSQALVLIMCSGAPCYLTRAPEPEG